MSTETGCNKESPVFEQLSRIGQAQERLDKIFQVLETRIATICTDASSEFESEAEKVDEPTELSRRIDGIKCTALRQLRFADSLIERIQL